MISHNVVTKSEDRIFFYEWQWKKNYPGSYGFHFLDTDNENVCDLGTEFFPAVFLSFFHPLCLIFLIHLSLYLGNTRTKYMCVSGVDWKNFVVLQLSDIGSSENNLVAIT